jgi:hypothetical protein
LVKPPCPSPAYARPKAGEQRKEEETLEKAGDVLQRNQGAAGARLLFISSWLVVNEQLRPLRASLAAMHEAGHNNPFSSR